MKVLVCGGRSYNNKDRVNFILDTFKALYPGNLQIIQGGAKGADKLAFFWARENNIPTITFRADWKTYGKSAGFIRNREMLDYLKNYKDTMVVVFPGGNGTAHMKEISEKAGIKVLEVDNEEVQ